MLRGKCRHCGTTISPLYPAVELSTACFFMAVYHWSGISWMLLPLLYFAAISVALFVIDLQTYRLPNAIVLPSAAGLAIVLPVCAWLDGHRAPWVVWVGAIVYCLVFFLPALIKPGAMGMGDVKLALILGGFLAWAGWLILPVGFMVSMLIGLVHSVTKMMLTQGPNRRKFPLGPSLLVGTWCALVWGQGIATWYWGLFT